MLLTADMPKNVEIKARLRPRQLIEIRDKALALSSESIETLQQTDTFYQAGDQRLKLREFDNGTAELIAYSRPDQPGPKLSSYIKHSCSNPESLHKALCLSLGVRGQVCKTRQVIMIGQTRVHLDQVEGLGEYLELEVVLVNGQSVAEGERIAHALLGKLGVEPGALLEGAYIDLLEAVAV